MPRECTVCSHPESFEINEAIVGVGEQGKLSNRAVTRQYGLSKDAVRRHTAHIPELLVKASQAMEIAEADGLIDQMRDLQQHALGILEKAEEAEDLRTALGAISQARGNLELLAKLQGELAQEGTINITLSPEWLELRAVIVGALEHHPDAKDDVVKAIAKVSNVSNGRAS
jgi:hypothetical protein